MSTITININAIVKVTDKAICFNCPVYWGNGNMKQKEVWMPKSVVSEYTDKCAEVADWFIRKTEQANSFNGYEMNFDR